MAFESTRRDLPDTHQETADLLGLSYPQMELALAMMQYTGSGTFVEDWVFQELNSCHDPLAVLNHVARPILDALNYAATADKHVHPHMIATLEVLYPAVLSGYFTLLKHYTVKQNEG